MLTAHVPDLRKIISNHYYKTLDQKTFDEDRARITELIKEKHFDPTLLKNASIETKLAGLEAMGPSIVNPDESLPEIYKSLSPIARLKLKHAANSIYSGKNLAQFDIDLKIEKVYLDILHARYPKITEGLKGPAVEKMLHDFVQARVASREIGSVLKDMGLINDDPSKFRKTLDRVLKGHGFRYSWNARINASAIFRLTKGHYVLGIPIPPKVFLQRWVKIPTEMFDRIPAKGLDHVWNNGLKDYLVKQNGTLIKSDIVFNQIQSAWDHAIDLAFGVYYIEKFDAWLKQRKTVKE